MIIEATPRLRDRPLEGYIPSPIDNINLDSNLTSVRYPTQVKDYNGPDQDPDSLSKLHTPAHITHQYRRSVVKLGTKANRSYSYHPYTRPGKRKSENHQWDSFLALQKCTQKERINCCNFLKSSYQFQELRKLERTDQRFNFTSSTSIPHFTANANENNDNCPKIEFGRSETVNDVRTQSENHICDVEIEDLTSEAATEESYCWRQRRKSFNTNPLSSTAARKLPDHPPNLLPLGNLASSSPIFPKEPKGHFEVESQNCYRPTIYQILGIDPEENTKLSSLSEKKASPRSCANVYANYDTNQDNTEDANYIVGATNDKDVHGSSIERLVNFFESNSSETSPTNNINQNQANFTCDYTNTGQTNCSKTKSFASSIHFPVANNKIRPIQKVRSCSSPKEFTQQCSKKSPFDLSHLLRDNHWNCVIKTSFELSRTSPSISTTQPRRVYNNNGNAASATIDSRFGWQANNKYRPDHFQSISSLENEKGHLPISYSNPVISSERGRSFSSLSSSVSSDIELIDLESTRLSPWPGKHSIPDAFARRRFPQEETTHKSSQTSDHLIDLQATSKRTACRHNNWFAENSAKSDFSTNSTQHQWENQLARFSSRLDKESSNEGYQEDRFKNSFCRDRAQHQIRINSNHLSTNNHHNTPGICDFNKCYSPLTVPNSAGPNSERQRLGNRPEINNSKQFPFGDFNLHRNLLDPNFFPSDSYDMGCIQSIAKSKVSPDRCHQNVIVENIQASIDRTPTEIEEKSPIVLRYRTPYFRASAHVIVPPIPRKETWTVGWIQACDSMKFINQYGDLGNSSWEIPALKDRRITAVSDSDGVSYPWYGNTTEIATLEGPTDTSRSLTLRMNDNFYPSVTWDIPVSEGSEAHLTHIVRDQSFTTWLAAVNQTTGRIEVLRTVKWHFYLEIDVDPTQELGKRARIVSPLEQKQPIILKDNTEPIYITSPARRSNSGSGSTGGRQRRLNRRHGAGGDNNSNNHTNCIPKSALVRPSANNAQTLIWRPTRDIPVVVVPAKEEYKENNEVVWFTRTPMMHGHDQNVRILSKQEMIHLKKSFS